MKKSFCFTLMILSLTACGNRQTQQEETGVSHQTMVTSRSDIALEQTYPASVEGRQSIRIIPRVEGYLAEIRIREGQRVSKGQVLFVLDQATYRADERAAQANVDVARAGVESAQLAYDSRKQLREKDIVSDFDLQSAATQLALAKAQLRLKRLLEGMDANYEVGSIVGSNAAAKSFFASQHSAIDLILSDIQLGDGLSFEGLRCAPVGVPVIFTTAYDQYAVQAFKFNSLDYLLKPIDETELRAALQKVQTIKTTATNTDAITQLLDVLGKGPIRYRERFLIPHKADEFLIIPANEVSHFVIQDGVVRLCTLSGVRHQLGMTLDEVESQLDPQRFMRVNRQYIVNASAVDKLSAWFQGKLRIYIKGFPDDEITVSKEKVSAVKRWLDS